MRNFGVETSQSMDATIIIAIYVIRTRATGLFCKENSARQGQGSSKLCKPALFASRQSVRLAHANPIRAPGSKRAAFWDQKTPCLSQRKDEANPCGPWSPGLGRSAALNFLPIAVLFAAKSAWQPIPIQSPRIHKDLPWASMPSPGGFPKT